MLLINNEQYFCSAFKLERSAIIGNFYMMTYSNLLLGFLYLTFLLLAQTINGSEVSHEDNGLKLNHHRIKRNSSANDENSEIPERITTRSNETSKDQEMLSTTKIWMNTTITSENLTRNYTTESSHDQTNQTFNTHENTVTEFQSGENTDEEEGSGETNETSGDGSSVDGISDTDDMTLDITTIRHSITTVQEDSSSNIVSILVPILLVFLVLSLTTAAVCIMKQKMYSVLPKYYE